MLHFKTSEMVSDGKVNILGVLDIIQVKSKKFPVIVFEKIGKNGNFHAKQVFDKIEFFIWL